MDHPDNLNKKYLSQQDRKDRKCLGLEVDCDHTPFFVPYKSWKEIPKEVLESFEMMQQKQLGLR
jgi:hypothetical protein